MKDRCPCGVLLSLVAEDPEPHLECRGLKRCTRCGEVKLVSDFWRAHGRPRARCKVCHHDATKARARERYRTDARYRAVVLARNASNADLEVKRLKEQARRDQKGDEINRRRRERYRDDPSYRRRRLAQDHPANRREAA